MNESFDFPLAYLWARRNRPKPAPGKKAVREGAKSAVARLLETSNSTDGMNAPFQVELVWNREFDFVPYGRPHNTVEDAVKYARRMEDMGDGASVKKTRVVDSSGKVVWAHGQLVTT